jgi:predicted nuclease with TOPRIM domain
LNIVFIYCIIFSQLKNPQNINYLNKGGIFMDVKSYCDSLVVELTGWKAKVYDVVRKLDKMSSGDKEKVVSQVRELHVFIEELDDRIEKLKRECPIEWQPEKIELEGKFTGLKTKWESVWQNVSPGDIGG